MTPKVIDQSKFNNLMDRLVVDLSDLNGEDRLASAARMMGSSALVGDERYRQAFATWRREAGL